ncbi:MAG: OOP family OmpA-OmpF porin [Cryomorphaceae bacterium]|jgi:OOP family OmpA-OmpF porin
MAVQPFTKTIIFGLIVASVGVGTYLGLSYLTKSDDKDKAHPVSNIITDRVDPDPNFKPHISPHSSTDIPDTDFVKPTADDEAERLGMNMKFDDPKELVAHVMKRMSQIDSERDIQDLAKMLGNGKVNTDQLAQLNQLFGENRMKLREEKAMELLGEIKAGKISRWALHLSDASKIQLQINRQQDGKWKIDQVMLPLSNMDKNGVALSKEQIQKRDAELEAKDSLIFSNNFLKALISQNFYKARMMADFNNVSDAKIAGLCILFEDGAYRLNEQKPLQAVRMTELMSAFYVNVNASDGSDAQFSINTLRDKANSPWQINEINLDKLLDDYAKRIAGGDVYYTPLIKNPNGGDMLVIYFDFDSNGLTEKTKTQLGIVANLLKLDNRKKVRLSGHTDGKGSDEYNQELSEKRAAAVKKYLAMQGIKPEQIVTEAHGFSKPRRPEHTKEDGADDPNARRANRRTEIYLDF